MYRPVSEQSSGRRQRGSSWPRLLSLAFGILSRIGCFGSWT